MRRPLIFVLVAAPAWAATFYISPSGGDSNSCTTAQSSSTPKKTFASMFTCGAAGDTYVLLDGTYSIAAGTGGIHWDTSSYPNSAPAPNGTSRSVTTTIRAQNPGAVKILVPAYIGRTATSQQYITFYGIVWDAAGGVMVRHSSYIAFKQCGSRNMVNDDDIAFSIGTDTDAWPSTHHILVEDCWAWSKSRATVSVYKSQYIVFRRVVVRGEGCTAGGCVGQPNVGVTIYWTQYASLQNVMVIDRLAGNSPYADFAQASHDVPSQHGNDEWLGCISLHSEEPSVSMDPENSSGTMTFKDFVIWDTKGGMNMSMGDATWNIDGATIYLNDADTEAGIRLRNTAGGSIRNVVVTGSGNLGLSTDMVPSYVDLYGTWITGGYYSPGEQCVTGCLSSNPRADTGPSIKHPIRIEAGSTLASAGYGGGPLGANVVYRYGTDGTIYGDPGFNALTSTPLWPWPNEAQIKADMCTYSSVTRGFCADTSLTHYVMNYLGNGNPYAGGVAPAITSTSPLPAGTVGAAYSQTLAATGDTPITWTVISGSLPGGLGLSTAGAITGTPTSAGAFSATIRASNATSSDSRAFSITINAAAVQRTRLSGRVTVSGGVSIR